MYVFDSHCDYLWMRYLGKRGFLDEKTGILKKTVLAAFEGKAFSRETVLKQVEIFRGLDKGVEAHLAFEGLSWVQDLKDADFIGENKPLYASPVWNMRNEMGGSCYEDGPLTIFGRCFLRELEARGVFIDLEHSGEEMFFSCLDNFKNVIYSHGNVFEIHSHPRNIRKNQIRALIERKSYFGLTLYRGFVGGDSVKKLVDHVSAVLDMGGENIVGIGSDLDGCDAIVGKSDHVFSELFEELLRRNLSENVIEQVLHKNFEDCLENFQVI